MLARKLDDASEVARLAGTSVTKAKATVQTAKALADADEVRAAFQDGDISCEQAPRSPGRNKRAPALPPSSWRWPPWRPSTCSKTRARKIVLEAEQHRGLAQRQREARGARSHADDLGMVHIELALEPHVGTPIVNRAEAEAGRLYREAKKQDQAEPFGRHLADAYAALLAGTGKCGPRRPELSVLVSHGVAQRGWKDVEEGEVCKIPGVGPVAPQVAKEIARDAFLTGSSTTAKIFVSCAAGPATPPSRSASPYSWAPRRTSTGCAAWIAATASESKTITSSPTAVVAPHPPTTSSPAAGRATWPRPSETAGPASFRLRPRSGVPHHDCGAPGLVNVVAAAPEDARKALQKVERVDVTAPSTIDDYLSRVPDEPRAALEKLRATVKAAAPDTTETISYQMPAFKYRGRALVGFAAFKNHCSLFPYSTKVLETYEEELGSMRTSKGTIQFSSDRPLPSALVEKIVKARIQEIDATKK